MTENKQLRTNVVNRKHVVFFSPAVPIDAFLSRYNPFQWFPNLLTNDFFAILVKGDCRSDGYSTATSIVWHQ